MSRRGTTPDLGKAILMSLDTTKARTVREVQQRAQVYRWDAELSMSSVQARLEMLVQQKLVKCRHRENGAREYWLAVDIEFC